jgi:hypothetical protein
VKAPSWDAPSWYAPTWDAPIDAGDPDQLDQMIDCISE